MQNSSWDITIATTSPMVHLGKCGMKNVTKHEVIVVQQMWNHRMNQKSGRC